MDAQLIEGLSLIKSSVYRRKILFSLKDNLITPSEIAAKTQIRLNHISRFLAEMKKKSLVECLNEKAKKGRIYRLTGLGKNVIDKCA